MDGLPWPTQTELRFDRQYPLGQKMRMFGAFLIFIAVTYFWDAEYNNGRLADGVRSMGRSIVHNMAP
jgi:hypothetical protein